MKFKNKNHQAIFSCESQKLNRNDNVKMSVLYLLTADVRLWNAAKPHIRKGYIDLDNISVKKGNLKSYARNAWSEHHRTRNLSRRGRVPKPRGRNRGRTRLLGRSESSCLDDVRCAYEENKHRHCLR